MRTNLEKYNYYRELLRQKAQTFIDSLFPQGKPNKFYEVNGYRGIQEYTVTSIEYNFGLYSKDKPTREDVNRAHAIYENTPEFSKDNVLLRYEYPLGNHQASGAKKLSKILNSRYMAFTAEDLEDELRRQKELYEPREGYIACSYCRKQNPPENIVYEKLIFRDFDPVRRKQFVNKKTLPYCKDTDCAINDQMAHEG